MEIDEKSYLNLLEESFRGIKDNIIRCETLGFYWKASKIFTKELNGKTVSHVSLLECPILIEGQWHKMGALHGICTHIDYRGQGLATELIQEALYWSEKRCEAVFLFTEIPAFYEKLAFHQIQEHRFCLPHSYPKGSEPLQPIISPQDNALFLRCFREREPVSNSFWVKDNGLIASFNTLFATYPIHWSVYYSSLIDGFICYQLENKTFHLFDIVARKIPSFDTILAHLPATINHIYIYFSPDRLTDKASPEPYLYDHGHLLVYGSWKFSHPFMISPLSRC